MKYRGKARKNQEGEVDCLVEWFPGTMEGIMMEVHEVHDKVVWDTLVEHGHFLQSYDWGTFQQSVGHTPLRLLVVEQEKTILAWQGFLHRLPLGVSYAYFPRVHVPEGTAVGVETLLRELQRRGVIFARIEPSERVSPVSFSVIPTPTRQPQHSLMVDLEKTDEECIAHMHAKTRYNIHLARRHGVTTLEKKDVNVFWQLNTETTHRDGFRSHEKVYYERMLSLPMVHQLTAYKDDTPVASILLLVHDGTMTYLHGASSSTARHLMAPYLLQWEALRLGKTLGCVQYDMWGVAPPADAGEQFHHYRWQKDHPWSGITRFKAGFGGAAVSCPKAFEAILRPTLYWVYRWGSYLYRMI